MNRHAPPASALTRRAALAGAAQAVAVLAAACTSLRSPGETLPAAASTAPSAPNPSPAPQAASAAARTSVAGVTQNRTCLAALPTVIPPTPIPYPGYTQVEPSTGLHVTAKPQIVDVAAYHLAVKGKVANELSLTYGELRCLPKISTDAPIECPGFFVDKSNLAGASLASVLALAGPLDGAKLLDLRGVDGRATQIKLDQAQGAEYFLAYEWQGEPLPVSHGFPVRAAMPYNIGGYWIKWLQEIEIS